MSPVATVTLVQDGVRCSCMLEKESPARRPRVFPAPDDFWRTGGSFRGGTGKLLGGIRRLLQSKPRGRLLLLS